MATSSSVTPSQGPRRLVVGGPWNDNTVQLLARRRPDQLHPGYAGAARTSTWQGRTAVTCARSCRRRSGVSRPLAGPRPAMGFSSPTTSTLSSASRSSTPRARPRHRLLAEGLAVAWAVYRPPTGDEIMIRGQGRRRLGPLRHGHRRVERSACSPRRSKRASRTTRTSTILPYSPDGTRIYYNRYTPEAETIQAWIMNADGSGQHRFNPSGPSCCWREGGMAPSPDGQSVVMWRRPVSETV